MFIKSESERGGTITVAALRTCQHLLHLVKFTLCNNWNHYLPTQLPNMKPGNCQKVLSSNLFCWSILYIKFIEFPANGCVWDSAAANAVSTTVNYTNTNSCKSVHFFLKTVICRLKLAVFCYFLIQAFAQMCVKTNKYLPPNYRLCLNEFFFL